jgi:hypothetical protein
MQEKSIKELITKTRLKIQALELNLQIEREVLARFEALDQQKPAEPLAMTPALTTFSWSDLSALWATANSVLVARADHIKMGRCGSRLVRAIATGFEDSQPHQQTLAYWQPMNPAFLIHIRELPGIGQNVIEAWRMVIEEVRRPQPKELNHQPDPTIYGKHVVMSGRLNPVIGDPK